MSPRIMPCAAPSGKSPQSAPTCGPTPFSSITRAPYPSVVSSAYSRIFPRHRPGVTCAGPEPAPTPPAPPAPPMR